MSDLIERLEMAGGPGEDRSHVTTLQEDLCREAAAALRAKDERIRDLEAALREARPYVKRHEYEPWRNAADQAAGELVSRIDALLGDKPAPQGKEQDHTPASDG